MQEDKDRLDSRDLIYDVLMILEAELVRATEILHRRVDGPQR